MAINQPTPKGKAVIVLATPLRDTPDDRRLALFLSGLVRKGEIEVIVPSVTPKKMPGTNFPELKEKFDPSKHIPSEDLSATVVQCDSLDEFFRNVDDQLSRTGRNGVVVFGTPIDFKSINKHVGTLAVSIPGNNYAWLPKSREWISVTQPVFPEIPSQCSHLRTRVQNGLSTDTLQHDAERIAKAIIEKMPVAAITMLPSKRTLKGWKVFKDPMRDCVGIVAYDGKSLETSMTIDEFEKSLKAAIVDEMISKVGLVARGEDPVAIGENTTFLSDSSSRSYKGSWSSDSQGGSLADDISRATALPTVNIRITSFNSMFDQLETLEAGKAADIHDAKLMETFDADAKSSARATKSRKEALPELEKIIFGTKSLKHHVGEIVAVAVDSRKTINAILGQHRGIDDIPFEDGLKLVSAIAVNQTATRQLELLASSEKAQKAIEYVLSRRTENDIHQLVEPISPRVVAPIAARVSALATDPEHIDQRGPLLIHVDETHAYAFQGMQQTTVDEEAKLVGKKVLDKSEEERGVQTALSRAKTLPGELASLHESADVPTVMDEVRAATELGPAIQQVSTEQIGR